MIRLTTLVCLTALLGACTTGDEYGEFTSEPSTVRLDESRPSTSLDVTMSDDLTTIELVKEKAEEIVRLKKRVGELEGALGTAEERGRDEARRIEEQEAQIQRLQTLLARMTAEHSELNERVVSLEIEKLRLEKHVLNMQLANLATAGDDR
jgi:chromosome segregation ATPase